MFTMATNILSNNQNSLFPAIYNWSRSQNCFSLYSNTKQQYEQQRFDIRYRSMDFESPNDTVKIDIFFFVWRIDSEISLTVSFTYKNCQKSMANKKQIIQVIVSKLVNLLFEYIVLIVIIWFIVMAQSHLLHLLLMNGFLNIYLFL